jgi:two-component system sensor histidine kinase RpfC
LSGLNILVAEDNQTNRLVISKILDRAGHNCVLVENGQLALDRLEYDRFDLVIMDMQMPVMGGIEAAKLYQFTTPLETRSPIIILTANATTEAKLECEEANVDAYLTKPIVASKLISTINTICSDANNRIRNSPDNPVPNDNTPKNNVENVPLLDLVVLNSVKDLSSDDSFINELIAVFINDCGELFAEMESAVAAKDYETYLENIHAMKGSAGSMGAQKLFVHCKQTLLQEPRTQNLIENLKIVNSLLKQTEEALSEYTESDIPSVALSVASGKSG